MPLYAVAAYISEEDRVDGQETGENKNRYLQNMEIAVSFT